MIKKILGIKVDDITSKEALSWVEHWLNRKAIQQRIIVTVGPEFIVTAQQDRHFRQILNDADLSLPEGIGLQHFAGVTNRIPGTEFMLILCQRADREGWKVGLFGGGEGIASKTKQELLKNYPNLKVAFVIDGQEADNIMGRTYSNAKYISDNSIQKPLNCDLLFVALGHPKQEKFLKHLMIDEHTGTIIKFKAGMGVGGAFDQISGNISRPPHWVSHWGFEWFYRIFVEKPGKRWSRLMRVFKASVIFPLLMIFSPKK